MKQDVAVKSKGLSTKRILSKLKISKRYTLTSVSVLNPFRGLTGLLRGSFAWKEIDMAKETKERTIKVRNWLAVHAFNRKGGPICNSKKKGNKSFCRGKVKDL